MRGLSHGRSRAEQHELLGRAEFGMAPTGLRLYNPDRPTQERIRAEGASMGAIVPCELASHLSS